MSRTTFVRTMAVITLLTLGIVPLWAAGGSSAPAAPAQDPRAAAIEDYNRALEYRDQAWEYEARMEGASEDERSKLEKKAQKEFQKMIRALESAIAANPEEHRALSSLGYALRRTGDYERSLEMYNRALELAPTYTEAIEYRAEAYLGLGRLDDAKSAYMELVRSDRERADQLLAAMQSWVEAAGPESDVEGVDEFAAWVEERAAMAEQTSFVPSAGAESWSPGS